MEEGERFVETGDWSGRRVRNWVRRGKGFGCATLGGRLIVIHDGSDRSAPSPTAGFESRALGAEGGVAESDHLETPAIVVAVVLSTTMLRRSRGAQRPSSVVAFSEVGGDE